MALPSGSAAASMAKLKERLATPAAAPASAPPRPPPVVPPASTSQRLPPSLLASTGGGPGALPGAAAALARSQAQPRQQPDSLLGVPLQLGEQGNPIQAMAALTYRDPAALRPHGQQPLQADAVFLGSLRQMERSPQVQAAIVMQQAAGRVPPPAVLVWAGCEVVRQAQAALREALGASAPASAVEAAAQAGALRAQPWYGVAVQLAHLATLALEPRPTSELQLLRAFAHPPPPAQAPGPAEPKPGPGPKAEADGAAPARELYVLDPVASYVPWEALMGLPGVGELLELTASRSPQLAAALELTAARQEPAAAAAGGDGWLLPRLRAAAAAARTRALEANGLNAVDPPTAADATLAAAVASGGVAAVARTAASDWLAAAALVRAAEERLGCVGPGTQPAAAAVVALLGLPREPQGLAGMAELQATEEEVQSLVAAAAAALQQAPPAPTPPAQPGAWTSLPSVPPPPGLDRRLAAAQQKLAAAGRALAVVGPGGAAAPEAAAAQTWLRAVGGPLASGLLADGYGSLTSLRQMAPELREALVLRLVEGGRTGGGAAALAAAWYGDAATAWRAARRDAAAAEAALAALAAERVAADLDLVHERFVPEVSAPPPPPALPSESDLASAVQSLPPHVRKLYDSYYAVRPDSDDGGLPDGLDGGSSGAEAGRGVLARWIAKGAGEVRGVNADADLKAWVRSVGAGVMLLPAPLLGLLLRFVRVQASVTPETAALQRTRLTALAEAVAAAQARAAAAAGSGSAAVSEPSAAAALAALAGGGAAAEGVLAATLGPAGAADFVGWLQSLALPEDPRASTHVMRAAQGTAEDVERYLTMAHDPRLHLQLGGLGPAAPVLPTAAGGAWRDPALRRGADEWLGGCRGEVDALLSALGHAPLGEAEWGVYREAALAEWEAARGEREAQQAAAGQSGFFNPRADEAYLWEMLEQGIKEGDPLGPQSRRYLDTLLRNPSWSFAQRRQAVQRLIQLNAHFASQPPAPADGSPFAPLFAVGGPDPVPRLGGSGGGAGGGKGAGGKGGKGGKGGADQGSSKGPGAKAAPQLPKGF
ncbi:hypothetical protein HYH03_006597 [Edaphochlamys debaryana]|uniref:Uncharacterized protein n=1 Tax=Edaphochlamys debaryana TaxID=47281 RepID=A0A836C0Y2_9CHLO|nr:hypothetical protein HYH03_006597 [Edaphochlamys debaryana]|eukprot:KAG2495327.1 hypothetical protein HYH03_006597 [Edaphochlamys debaryana]